MLSFTSRILVTATLAATAFAATTQCIVSDLEAVQKKTELLGCLVSGFEHSGGCCLHTLHDLRPLLNIFFTSIELDALLETAIDDVQTSCDFSDQASQEILLALAQIEQPLTTTLNAFAAESCDFVESLGPHFTRDTIGGSLRQTRHLTLNLLRSITFKAEPQYRPVIKTAAEGINQQFTDVIRKYYAII